MSEYVVGGPYFEDLEVGDVFTEAPAVTLTPGLAAAHQSIVGNRLKLALDEQLSRRVLGGNAVMAHPSLVWDISIGQSTAVTQRVVANLFYRGFAFHRAPQPGDTLSTRTEVVALRQNRSRPTGLAALRVTTTDQQDRLVLDFWRCAMLPLRDPGVDTGKREDLDAVGRPPQSEVVAGLVDGFDLTAFPAGGQQVLPGDVWHVESGDVVSSAPELARLTLNVAAVHHDEFAGGSGRLVYGGTPSASRCRKSTARCRTWWRSPGGMVATTSARCGKGDTLYSRISAEEVEQLPGGGVLVHLGVRVRARSASDPAEREVLDWRPIVVLASGGS
ncbi:MaoC family dehydratase [Saccharopolyspora rectivirgula]|uniref:MaoC family dehydratase n=1 Tax=Saccharopolyspora rectivirgula TaxID=28042 RepID=UPI00240A135B|nr:MaoC family dehydratase [Saccharopolyspora rectivirgula]